MDFLLLDHLLVGEEKESNKKKKSFFKPSSYYLLKRHMSIEKSFKHPNIQSF